MKMLKKMAALLLAGVMAMALLTACGDDTPSKSLAQQAEEAAFAAAKTATGIQVNDADLKKLAESKIDTIKDGVFAYDNAYDEKETEEFLSNIGEGKAGSAHMTMPLPEGQVTGEDYKVLEVTAGNLGDVATSTAGLSKTLDAMMKSVPGAKISKLGVAAKTINGKTYVAISILVEVPAQQ